MAFALHPARLISALVAAGAVAVASAVVTFVAPAIGVAATPLAPMIGGLVAFNVLLLFPQGGLAPHLGRLPVVLAANVLPLPVTVLAHHAAPWLADLLLVAATGAVSLARPAGPVAMGTAFTLLINVLAPLVLGSPMALVALGPLAGVVGTVIGFAADGLTLLLLARFAAPPERWLLAIAAADELEALGRRWVAPATRSDVTGEPRRFTSAAADFALTAPGVDTLMPHHLMESVGRTLQSLQRLHDILPPELESAIRRALPDIAAQFRAGSPPGAEAVADRLRASAVAAAPEQVEVTARALTLALLLGQLARATLAPRPAGPVAPSPPFRVSKMQIRLILQAMICVGVAIIASDVLPTSRPYWIPLTAAILICASYGETVRKTYERVLGTVGGLITGELAWLVLHRIPPLVSLALLLSIAGIFFVRAGAYRWMLFWLTAVLSLLLLRAGQGSLLYGGRLPDTLIGAVIALLVTRWVLPVRGRDAGRAVTTAFLRGIAAWLRSAEVRLAPAAEPNPRGESLGPLFGSLSTMHALADAEVLEAWPRRSVAPRVASRLAAADRIARGLVMLEELLALCVPAPEPFRRAFLAAADMAEKAALFTDAPPRPEFSGWQRSVQEEGAALPVSAERLAAELRALTLLSTITGAIDAMDVNR